MDPDKVTVTKAVAPSTSEEIIVATTAGFTDKVEGALITNDEREAFNKVLNDWNISDSEHTGYKVDHGHGLWSIRQISATEYKAVSSHNLNKMFLLLDLSKINASTLSQVTSIHFSCTVTGVSCNKADKYRVKMQLIANGVLLGEAGSGNELKTTNDKGNAEFLNYELRVPSGHTNFKPEWAVKCEIAGKDVEYWSGNHGAMFCDYALSFRLN